jgi:2-hydroxychromene-2-carboxylate isomerase
MRDHSRTQPSPPQFFFGAMSPYSWLAAERIERVLPQARWRGVLAGAIFKAHDRVSWGLTECRDEGIADCEKRAAAHGLGPIHWPRPWPTSDLLIARAMVYAEQRARSPSSTAAGSRTGAAPGGLLKPLALAAMRMAFLEGADLGDADTVVAAGERAGMDAGELRAALQAAEVKDGLRAATDEALALGVFGVPTVVVGGRLFWGDDRLEEALLAQSSLSGS